ncbi:hypothetical protein L4D06_04790 [Enterovibrio makurazakiensis]|uniref:Lipoprotein n=1 Tax=Enterovibrio gelatinilyticus TaxID=2899819 RepID=A0ABT5QV95_9GAMM|nr:hypothetical protein [Enterovibrio sp. ZSDZ42]MDD1791865.1 hypothetical protein [Enterovibrio sp. ZSDZ42]
MNLKKCLVLLAVVVGLVGCGRVQPIKNVESVPVAFNVPVLSVKQAIMESGADRGWIMTETAPGVIRGELFVRSHRAVIDVTYSDKSYSIDYVDSENLKYSDGKIHRNYNRWINNLDVDIRKHLAVLSASKS